MNTILMYYLIIINIVSFLQMGMDKRRAIKQKWRIQEKTIWLYACLGGALGSFLGMRTFRHKTKHTSFKIGLPCLTVLESVIIIFINLKL